MKKLSIKAIRQRYKQTATSDLAAFVERYQYDNRKGVKQIVKSAEYAMLKHKQRQQHLNSLYQFDLDYCKNGYVIGVDEAGRGPLAGPVVAAACIIKSSEALLGLDDSKKLSEAERERLYRVITSQAISYGVGIVDSDVIDSVNILNATKMAMQKAIESADKVYDIILTDFVKLSDVDKPLYGIVKGDAKSLAIAAASIIAKVTRDRLLKQYDQIYPQYGFAKHKGYGTAYHIAQIKTHGSCNIHRQSFIQDLK